jgi:ABC-type antimicrobial peptide transport system permease subunit
MTPTTLLRRNLWHYRRTHLAVLAGCVVGTAVLGGALLVGDSVRGSLRDMTLRRLGGVHSAVQSPRFVRAELAAALPDSVGAVQVRGSVVRVDDQGKTLSRVGRVQVFGADAGFWAITGSPDPGLPADGVALNESLAAELGAAVGDVVLVRFEGQTDVPREAVFGSRKYEDTVGELRATVAAILPADGGAGRFSLQGGQQIPRSAVVPIAALQKALGRRGQVNTFLTPSAEPAAALQAKLAEAVTPPDLGLTVRTDADRGYVAVESPQLLLDPAAEKAVLAAADKLGLRAVPVLTHLANDMTTAPGKPRVPYSTITAVDAAAAGLTLIDGSPAPTLKGDEILISEWAAARQDLDLLAAPVGTPITVSYYVEGDRGKLKERSRTFTLRGIVKLDDAAGDRGFAPTYPGITDKATLGDWDPPFYVDMRRIRNRDDQFWKRYKAAPKAFVSLTTGQELWGGRFGSVTSIRLYPKTGTVADAAAALAAELPKQLPPEKTGLVVRGVLAEGLAASAGATDFAGLFIGFSFFLIVSAALLVGLMFRLGVEQRLRELGVLTALGFRMAGLRRMLLAEGAVVAAVGGLPGAAAGVGYAWLMLAGLRTWWVDAVGTPYLELHAEPVSLVVAAPAGPVIAMIAVVLSLRGLRDASPRALLGGVEAVEAARPAGPGRASRVTLIAAGIAAVGLTAGSFLFSGPAAAGMFFGAGAALLTAMLAGLNRFVRGAGGGSAVRSALRLAVRNAARRPARSVLTAGLTASATFLIIAVAANRHDVGKDVLRKDSGAGGFAIIAETDLPVLHDLNSPDGRKELGFRKADEELMAATTVFALRLKPGDDASCRNLYRPQEPRVLGVPDELIERGGFRFADYDDGGGKFVDISVNPWNAISGILGGRVPAMGDANTLQWILHKSLGDEIQVLADDGRETGLLLTASLAGSVFQSEILISEDNFRGLFPTRSGHRVFLIEPPPGREHEVAALLNERLAEYGMFTESTAERLAAFAAIENTYLSTFQQLGGLGLLLGTLGLGAVMLRNVLERRGELALMRALGFAPGRLARVVMLENAALLAAGLGIGTAAALPAAAPQLAEGGGAVQWGSLAGTLAAVAAVGLLSGSLAALSVLRTPLLPALRAE